MRRNYRNIFRQLSRANDASRRSNPIMNIPVRPDPSKAGKIESPPSDAPSLLFHYLFDDWMTTYSLVARKEHQYGVQLEQLVSLPLTISSDHANCFKAKEAVFQTWGGSYWGSTQGRTSTSSIKANVRELCPYNWPNIGQEETSESWAGVETQRSKQQNCQRRGFKRRSNLWSIPLSSCHGPIRKVEG